MTPSERRAHALKWLAGVSDSFGTGPRWTFSVDVTDATSVGGVDVNLASDHAPPGEANISYWVHPAFRRRGIAPVAVRMALQFLRDHTSTRHASSSTPAIGDCCCRDCGRRSQLTFLTSGCNMGSVMFLDPARFW